MNEQKIERQTLQIPDKQNAGITSVKTLLSITAVIEAINGFLMLTLSSLVVTSLFGILQPSSVEIITIRLVGVTVISFGFACWFARNIMLGGGAKGFAGALLLFNAGAAVLLIYANLGLGLSGFLLWPGILFHSLMGIWCVVCLLRL
jgi:hypothetical protein